MTAADLRARIKSGDPHGFYIFAGEEEYLKRHYRRELRALCAPDEALALFNHTVFDGEDMDVLALCEAVKSPPMMSDYKLIEWRFANLDKLREGEKEALMLLCEQISDFPYACLVISALPDGFDTGTPKKPSKLYKRLSEGFEILNFEKSTDAQLIAWLKRHFDAEGVFAAPEVLTAMLFRVGHSMLTLSSEVEKLCAYAKARSLSEITVEDVNEITSSSVECDAFAISNAIIDKNAEAAFLALIDMKARRIEPGAAIAQLAKAYSELMSISLLVDEGKGAEDIAALMKFHPYRTKLYIASAKKLGSRKISEALQRLIRTDAESKAGGISGWRAVELFIAQNL
jgi:DNA polymerase-3 subunit delta